MQARLDAALEYASRGWPVFPCYGKKPAVEHGVLDASTDAETVRLWFGTKYPNHNIGVACGAVSGFWVLDIDPRHGGDETLAELEKLHGTLPTTVEQFTGGGGRHILFKFNGEKIPNRANHLGAGLDVRATGGYIIAAPSCHPETKRLYAWNVDAHPDEVEIADAPAWLVDLVTAKPAPERRTEPAKNDQSQVEVDGSAYGQAALSRECAAIANAGDGEQESTLNAAAFSIGQLVPTGDIDLVTARTALIEAARLMPDYRADAPWTEDLIAAKVEHGLRDGMAKPREIKKHIKNNILSDSSDKIDEQKRPRLKPLAWAEIETLPKREPLVRGILDRGAMSVSYGAPKSGKSFCALDLGVRVALGWEWFGRKVRQGPVVYIAAEGGMGIQDRLAAFRYHHDVEPSAPLFLLPVAVDLCGKRGDVNELIGQIKPIEPVLVTIDTLSRTLAGGNENSPEDMGAFVHACDLIREATGAHVNVVHHSGKDESRGMRGHNLLLGAVDTLIEIVKEESGVRTATVKEQREHEDGATFTFRLEPVDLGLDEDGATVTSCVVVPAEIDGVAPARPKIKGQAALALRMLEKALNEEGEAAPANNHIPRQVKTVQMSLWRRYCDFGMMRHGETPDARRKAFGRAADRLQVAQLIGIWGDFVWLAE